MGDPIKLSAARKRILARVKVVVGDVFDWQGELENSVARGETRFFAENSAGLLEAVRKFRRLDRGLVALARFAGKEAAR